MTPEGFLIDGVHWLRLLVEATGAAIVGIGFLLAGAQFVKALLRRQGGSFTAIRLTLARYLALALEFQLGADILSTAVAPTWDQIGKLAAVAIIRTALNYFLSLEMKSESEIVSSGASVQQRAP